MAFFRERCLADQAAKTEVDPNSDFDESPKGR
jgi:hypothetical protein